MTDSNARMCVIVPCARDVFWAVPQGCLAEILTIPDAGDEPPARVNWRGRDLGVLDLGREQGPQWRNPRSGSGLIMIVLGLAGDGGECWGVAVRGEGLTVREVDEAKIEDMPDAVAQFASAAFGLGGREVYQVPDLCALQRWTESQVA